jgi:prepilin peptidase CpaA
MPMQWTHIHVTPWDAAVLAFVVTAAASDLRWRRVPRWLIVTGFLCGLLYHALCGGILMSLVAAFLGFAAGLALFQLGAIGGGDVKLITALGAMLGFSHWVLAMEVAIFASAAIALAQAAVRGTLRQTVSNVGELAGWLFSRGAKRHPSIHVGNSATLRAPFAVAAALGTFAAIWWL